MPCGDRSRARVRLCVGAGRFDPHAPHPRQLPEKEPGHDSHGRRAGPGGYGGTARGAPEAPRGRLKQAVGGLGGCEAISV